MQVIYTDILIIGSGAAGLAATVYAGESDNEILVIDKGAVGKSGSTVGAVQVASLGPWSHPNDSSHNYSTDITTSGRGLSDPDLIETLVKHISSRLSDLTEWGLKLDTDEKFNVALSATSGHSLPRSVSAKKGKTGLGILQILIRKVKTLQNVETWSDVITLDLIVFSNRVTGAVVLDLTTNTTFLIKSKTVILATGGAGQLYPVTSNPVQATSDGFSLALGAGGTLMDMEQVQFYPVSIIAPESLSGFCISFYHYSKLYNNLGERFMEKYEPKELENTTRDKLAIAIATEIAEGRGTPNGGVWLDASEQLDQVKTEFPHEYALCSERGINLENGFAEIGPAAHFMMGGIPINVDTSTTVDGLFVAGETAGGLHGGNRLGNNALSECLVFGEKAGKAAAKTASISSTAAVIKEEEYKKAETIVKHFFLDKNGDDDIRPYQFKQTIQSIMGKHAGVLRSTRGLAMAEKQLQIAQEKLKNIQLPSTDSYSREILDYVESVHMLRTAQAIVKAAQIRKESRGAHFNKDFPHLSDKVCHTFCSLGQNEVACKYLPVKEERLWKSFTSK